MDKKELFSRFIFCVLYHSARDAFQELNRARLFLFERAENEERQSFFVISIFIAIQLSSDVKKDLNQMFLVPLFCLHAHKAIILIQNVILFFIIFFLSPFGTE